MPFENAPTSQPAPIDLNEARDLMMKPVLEEFDRNDPQFDEKYRNMTERRKREEEVRTALFARVAAGTATPEETELVVEVVKDRPYYVQGHPEYMSNPILAQAAQEANQL